MVPSDETLRQRFTVTGGEVQGSFGSASIDFTATWEPTSGMTVEGIAKTSLWSFIQSLLSKTAAESYITITGKTEAGEMLELREALITNSKESGPSPAPESKVEASIFEPWVHLELPGVAGSGMCRALLRGFQLSVWPELTEETGPRSNEKRLDRLTLSGVCGDVPAQLTVTDAKKDGYPGCAWLAISGDIEEASSIHHAISLKDFGQLILGEQVDLLWIEFELGKGRWKRLFHKSRPYLRVSGQPMIPTHDRKATTLLPELFEAYMNHAVRYRLYSVGEQLLRARYVHLNDTRRELSIALESLSDAHQQESVISKPTPPVPNDDYQKIVPILKDVLRKGLSPHSEGLKILERRLDSSFNNPTNQAKHLAFLKHVGIDPTPAEQETLLSRNAALHGAELIPLEATAEEVHNEARSCGVFRTILHKAILRLLKYQGPIVDYGQRGRPPRA